jgi:membrane fusion protein (multidrug efflux system)
MQVGNLVSPQSVLTSASQLDPIKVYFSISDAEYLALIDRVHAVGGNLQSLVQLYEARGGGWE